MKKLWIAGLTVLLSACGSGGDSSPAAPNSPLAGLYSGSVEGGNDVGGLVLANGEYWFAYGTEADGVLGVVQGTLSANAGNFSSSDARDFSLEDEEVLSGSLTGTYVAGSSIDFSATFPAAPDASGTGSLTYESGAVPTTATLAGNYDGMANGTFGSSLVEMSINSSGAITGEDDTGCTFTGQLSPVKGGYTLRVSFGGGTCYYPGQTLHGVALDEDGVIIGALKSADRTGGIVFDIEFIPPAA